MSLLVNSALPKPKGKKIAYTENQRNSWKTGSVNLMDRAQLLKASLTGSLRGKLVKSFTTLCPNTPIFLLKK